MSQNNVFIQYPGKDAVLVNVNHICSITLKPSKPSEFIKEGMYAVHMELAGGKHSTWNFFDEATATTVYKNIKKLLTVERVDQDTDIPNPEIDKL